MFYEKCLPIKSFYKFSKSKQKPNYSPNRKYNLQPTTINAQQIPINQKKKKRIMTECNEQLDRSINKSTIPRNQKANLFLKQIEDISKEKPNDRFLKRFEKNNHMGIQSTKYNENRNTNLRSLYGGTKIPKKKIKGSIQKEQIIQKKQLNHISLVKLLEKKDMVKKINNNLFIDLNDVKRKSFWDKSGERDKKKTQSSINKNSEKNVIDINKLNINLDKPNQKKSLNKDKTTVQTVKKHNQDTIHLEQELIKYDLTEEQYQTFGNRFPYGFQKIKLLGRGGFSLVWLGEHKKSKKLFAVKQIITQNNHQTHMKQIWFGSIFFTLGGLPRPEFAKHIGIKNLAKMYSYEINQSDTWIFYEKCGNSLGSCLYDIQSQRYAGEKVYKIHYKPLYKRIMKQNKLLKKIIIEVCKALQLLTENLIVHSDLKTQNILIRYDDQISQVKLIDYGSSFSFTQINQFSMATPEYMSHQILNYILCQNQSQYDQQLLKKVKNYQNPWVIDIWSLGCVLLELINGIPLWMSLPVLVNQNGEFKKKYGLFAVKGRIFQKIIDKQIEVIENLDEYLYKCNYSGIILDEKIIKVLKGMLQLQPQLRMSPKEVINILSQSDQ